MKNEKIILQADTEHKTPIKLDFFNMKDLDRFLISRGGKSGSGKSFSSYFKDDEEYKSISKEMKNENTI